MFDVDQLHLQLAFLDQFVAPFELDPFATSHVVEMSEVVVGGLSEDPATRFPVTHDLAGPVRRGAQHLTPFHPAVTLDHDLRRPLVILTVVDGELGNIPVRAETNDVAVAHGTGATPLSLAAIIPL